MKISALWTLLLGVLALVVQMLQGEAFLDAAWAPAAVLVLGLVIQLIKVYVIAQERGRADLAAGELDLRAFGAPSLWRVFWLG